MSLSGSSNVEKLVDLATKTYKEQAVWFLNAFWEDFAKDQADQVWRYKHSFDELDHVKKEQGCALDEMQTHRFLEKYNEVLTVQEMREKLRSSGAITDNKLKSVSLAHLLLWKYNAPFAKLVNAPQGNKEEVAKATNLLDEVQAAFQESSAREAAAKEDEAAAVARESEAKSAEAEAISREAAAREQEAPFKAAQEAVDSALAEVKAQEDARASRTAELTKKSSEGGVVQQNKAKAELAQHLNEDPLPLRKAKITLEAALPKAERARAPFEASTKAAEAARAVATKAAQEAEHSRTAASESARQAENAVEEARKSLEAAEAWLAEAKNRLPYGQMWWLDRELAEKRKYLPKRQGGVDKK